MRCNPERFAEMQAEVVELLTARGPLPISEIRAALFERVSTGFINHSLSALLEAGRVVTEKRQLESTYHGARRDGQPRTQRYVATVYAVAPATSKAGSPDKRRRPPR